MKKYAKAVPGKGVVASSVIQANDDYSEYNIWFAVYELDEDGYEVDRVESFDNLDDAIQFAESQDYPTLVCFVPEVDPDDDPDYAEYIEYNYDYEPYEVVWSSDD